MQSSRVQVTRHFRPSLSAPFQSRGFAAPPAAPPARQAPDRPVARHRFGDVSVYRVGETASKAVDATTAGSESATPTADRRAIQRVVYPNMAAMWAAVEPTKTEAQILNVVNADPALAQAYTDISNNIAHYDFNYMHGVQPRAGTDPNANVEYPIDYGLRVELHGDYNNVERYVGAVLHEMMHISAALQYATNVGAGVSGHLANMNLPPAVGAVLPMDAEFGLTPNQFTDVALGAQAQMATIGANWQQLQTHATEDVVAGTITPAHSNFINGRVGYAQQMPHALSHYDTVLTDILYFLHTEGVAASRSYTYAHNMLTEANARRTTAVGAVAAIPALPPPLPPAPRISFGMWFVGALVLAAAVGAAVWAFKDSEIPE